MLDARNLIETSRLWTSTCAGPEVQLPNEITQILLATQLSYVWDEKVVHIIGEVWVIPSLAQPVLVEMDL
jgi:hypothetical protein